MSDQEEKDLKLGLDDGLDEIIEEQHRNISNMTGSDSGGYRATSSRVVS